MNRHILIDENIPLAEPAFSHLGCIERFSGRALSQAQIDRADALIVRSITRVSASLLQGSKVSFVGTCTIGTDHIELDALKEMGVATASAPGCNANSVVEYVLTALVALGEDWQDKQCMVIGCGNVGHRLAQRLQALGANVVGYDPFLSQDERAYLTDFSSIVDADIVCVHTPYTQTGPFPSHHILNADILSRLKPNAVLINAGRGGAIDNQALLHIIQAHSHKRPFEPSSPPLRIALDVWENEPNILTQLMDKVDLATPHIAGYSWDGKAKGTWQIAQALEQHWSTQQLDSQALPASSIPTKSIPTKSIPTGAEKSASLSSDGWQKLAPAHEAHHLSMVALIDELPSDCTYIDLWQKVLSKVYDIRSDDQRLRQFLKKDRPQASEELDGLTPFDYLRKRYPIRREWQAFTLDFTGWGDKYATYRQRFEKDATIMGFTSKNGR